MNQAVPDAKRLRDLRKMSFGIGLNFWLGVIGVILCFFENSPAWTFYIVLTAWIGVVMGLTGGPGFADYLLGRLPPQRQVSKGMLTILSLVTFWIPTLAAAVFAMAMAGALSENHQPQSRIDDNSMKMILQSFAMYFISAGTTWMIVGREVRLAQKQLAANEEPATGSESA